MNALGEYLNLGLGALFLEEQAFEKMREDSKRVTKGLTLILFVGVVVALVAVIGKLLEWSTTPDLANLPRIITEEISRMTWYRNPEAQRGFDQGFTTAWQFIGPLLGVNMVNAVLNVIINPIILTLRWLIYGVVAYLFARILGGKGNLSQTLGCTALAVAPEMLNIVTFVPYVQVGGVAIWGLICAYLSLKVSHQLSPWRAFWAALLPAVVPILLGVLLGCCIGVALGVMLPAGGGR